MLVPVNNLLLRLRQGVLIKFNGTQTKKGTKVGVKCTEKGSNQRGDEKGEWVGKQLKFPR